MPRTRDRYHHGDLKNALLQAALRLVDAHGVDGFSLREAARQCGVSVSAAYRHFPDRAALLEEVALDGLGRLRRGVEEAVAAVPSAPDAPESARARARATAAAYVQFASENAAWFRTCFGPHGMVALHLDPQRENDPAAHPEDLFHDAADGLIEAGVVTADRRAGASVTLWCAVHGLATLLVEGGLRTRRPADTARHVDRVLAVVLAGLHAA